MTAAADSTWMTVTQAEYTTQLTIVTNPGSGFIRVLKANPRRWFVRFESPTGGSSMDYVCPGPVPPFNGQPNSIPSPQEWKFLDCPSLVTGEWYAVGLAGFNLLITEVLYMGP